MFSVCSEQRFVNKCLNVNSSMVPAKLLIKFDVFPISNDKLHQHLSPGEKFNIKL